MDTDEDEPRELFKLDANRLNGHGGHHLAAPAGELELQSINSGAWTHMQLCLGSYSLAGEAGRGVESATDPSLPPQTLNHT